MDTELASSSVLTSDELRVAALAASARRGAPVARRRIVLRWSAWLLWGCLLPVIGLATVLAVLLTFASIEVLGPAKVFDTSQTWLAAQLGLPNTKAASGLFDLDSDKYPATLPDFNAKPGVIPQLQIDRNYSNHDQGKPNLPAVPVVTNAPVVPSVPVTSAAPNPSSSPKPPGAQP